MSYAHLFQLRSNILKLFDLTIRFLIMFVQISPDMPFHSKLNTCKDSFKSPIVFIRADKALRKQTFFFI